MARRSFVLSYVDTSRLTLPGGSVHRWAEEKALETEALAVGNAPVGARWASFDPFSMRHAPGELAASHHSSAKGGRTDVRIVVWNTAAHAKWVHDGTTGPITANGGGRMVWHDWGQARSAYSVGGQDPQPWLREAMETAFAPYRR